MKTIWMVAALVLAGPAVMASTVNYVQLEGYTGCGFAVCIGENGNTGQKTGSAVLSLRATDSNGVPVKSIVNASASARDGAIRMYAEATDSEGLGSVVKARMVDYLTFQCIADLLTGACADFVEDGVAEIQYRVTGSLRGRASVEAGVSISGFTNYSNSGLWSVVETQGVKTINQPLIHRFILEPNFIPSKGYGMTVSFYMNAESRYVGRNYLSIADLMNTGQVSVTLPRGWTMTSASGQFLAGPSDPQPVPEPATMALCGAGLAAAAMLRRRK